MGRFVLALVKVAAVLVVAQLVLPGAMRPSYAIQKLLPKKPLQTVTVSEAKERVLSSRGRPSVSVLYLTIMGQTLQDELAKDVKRWQKDGAAVHAFAIDSPADREFVPAFARSLGRDVAPVWIQMPEGDQCALKQLEAVTAFAGVQINPAQTIPLVTLVLRDAGGNVLKTKSVNIPNGGGFDPQELEHALAPFDLFVRRALR